MNNTNNTNYLTDPLWLRIERYQPDDTNATYPFSAKLAQEQGWRKAFTLSAIEEYKRFIYLCCISPTGASPSQIVDEVWHLHLTYTIDYWQRFCKHTLQQDVHHHPSAGGDTEDTRHNKWYTDTLELYAATFGTEPPEDIWPRPEPVEIKAEPIAIDPDHFRPSYNKQHLLLLLPFLMIWVLFHRLSPFYITGPHFLLFYVVLTVITLIIIATTLHNKERQLEVVLNENLTTHQQYETLYVKGEEGKVSLDIISELLAASILIPLEDGNFEVDKTKAATYFNPIAPALAAYPEDTISVDTLKEMTTPIGLAIKAKYTPLEEAYNKWTSLELLPILTLFLGAARLIQGINNQRPIAFLLILMGLYALACNMLFKSATLINICRFIFRGNNADNSTNKWTLQEVTLTGMISFWMADSANQQKTNGGGADGSGGGGSGGCSGGGGCGGGCGGCGGGGD